jgi:hypothetical protein
VYDQDDVRRYIVSMNIQISGSGKTFDFATHVVNNMENFRKLVRYSRPPPNILLRRVTRVFDKYCDRLDSNGVKLFSEVNRQQWRDYCGHVSRFALFLSLLLNIGGVCRICQA